MIRFFFSFDDFVNAPILTELFGNVWLILQNKRWIPWLKQCWRSQHAVLWKHREREKTFFLFVSVLSRPYKNSLIPRSFLIFFVVFLYCRFSKPLNTRRVWCFFFLIYNLCLYSRIFTASPVFIGTWVLQKLNKVQSDSFVSCGRRAAASSGFSRGAA